MSGGAIEEGAASWYHERLPALRQSLDAPELVLLHGWGMSSAVWRGWLGHLRRRCNVTLLDLPGCGRSPAQPDLTLEALLDQLAAHVPEGAVLAGWSLGGQIAAAFAGRHPHRCAGLALLACNPRFVAAADWPDAMAPTDFAAFRAEFERDPAALHKRFLALQARGADNERALLKWLRGAAVEQPDTETLRFGLDLLERLDVRAALQAFPGPVVHLFGENDVLAPGTAAAVALALPRHWVIALAGVSHLPFVSQPELSWQHLLRLLAHAQRLPPLLPPPRAKQAVADSFSRAAASYDGAAALQRRVADTLAGQITLAPGARLLDLGCGTGVHSAGLARRFEVIALDLAPGMLAHARAHNPGPLYWIGGDAESLPLEGASVDAVYSSLALQWCDDFAAVAIELRRVLRPGGRAWIATLGPRTLHELRAAWAEADGAGVHVNRFSGREQIARGALAAGLQIASWSEAFEVLQYDTLRGLTRELKALGAHNVNSGRPTGLTGRQRLQRFADAYEAQRSAGRLPATYQVWYLELQRHA